ncbi:hypothetical protein V6Z12_D02G020400 [Gossypium hirsutum]
MLHHYSLHVVQARRNRSYSPNLLNRSASKLNHKG